MNFPSATKKEYSKNIFKVVAYKPLSTIAGSFLQKITDRTDKVSVSELIALDSI